MDERDHDEWLEVARRLIPDLTDEEYEAQWLEFQEAKRKRRAH
jgi:hypothetical protein